MLIESIQKEFLADKKYEGLKRNSLVAYETFFKNWNQWLHRQNIEHLEELNPRLSKKYLMDCVEKGNNAGTHNTKLKLLRSFSKWLVEEGIVKEMLTQNIKAQKEDHKPKIVSTDDLKLVLSTLRRNRRRDDTFTSRRNYALILFLTGTGLRIKELERLTWADIDFQDSLIRINESKSRKQQSVPLSEALSRELLDWRLFLERKFEKMPLSLFVTEKGEPFSRNGMQNFFKRLKKKLGLQSDFSPHALRAYFIKELLKNGGNLREVQLLARHSKITVTQLYIGYFAHELKDSLDTNNPLNDLI
ncbi:tyrosine-type recombinase/integrase [Baia soyae]|uniref:Integrase/recombinase XerC/integrase/recombinase XerD n=1 Tax=Baia soyae TaxID=1544746 RepID=A0A4R2RRL1_9BACL|nr:tyrosine-type recombinase/integrase [Baia soyae]TCP65449.1 integrase/recombinase XerC/integrase/recombinase XerD [Baia soyae]